MATKTRSELEAIIRSGESVIVGGVVYSTVETLPSNLALAGNDPVKLEDAEAAAKAKRDEADAELARIVEARKAAAAEKAKPVAPAPPAKP